MRHWHLLSGADVTRAEKTDQTQIENACLAACRSEAPFLLSEMASFVTHKAKNPLAGMMLLASRLKRNVPPGDES